MAAIRRFADETRPSLEAGAAPVAEPFMGRQVVLFESVLERGRPPAYRPVTRLDLGEQGLETRDT